MAFNLKSRALVSTSPVALEVPNDTGTEQATETVINTDSEGETQKAKALALAARESEEQSAAVTTAANAKEDWQGGPINVLFAMKENYGDDIDTFPEPDLETGNNRDKFKVAVTADDGSTAVRPTSFYTIFADGTKEGKAIVEELKHLKRIGNVNDKKDNIPEHLIDLYIDDESARDDRLKYLNGRRGTIRQAYKKAMKLYFQLGAVNSLPLVECDFSYSYDKDGEVTGVAKTTNPIEIWQLTPDGKRTGKRVTFSIGSFGKLNPKAALEKGGTLKDLLKTVARDTNNGGSGQVPAIKTAETWLAHFVETFRAMDEFQSAEDQKEMGKLNKLSHSSDEFKVSLVEFRNYLDDMITENKLDTWYADQAARRNPLITRKAA